MSVCSHRGGAGREAGSSCIRGEPTRRGHLCHPRVEKVTRPELSRLYAEARAAALAGDSRATTLAVARLLSYSEAFGFYVQKLGADPAFAGFVQSNL
jgi:hypothetical protein